MSGRQLFLVLVIMLSAVLKMIAHGQENKLFVIGKIHYSGNRVTKNSILTREMEVQSGDTLYEKDINALLEKSRENLLNTTLFNFVDISKDTVSSAKTTGLTESVPGVKVLNIVVKVVERWYTWPAPFLMNNERNFNSWLETGDFDYVTYGVILQQNNFRGRKEKLLLTYLHGYNQSIGLTYENPNFNRKKTAGFMFSCFYTRNHSAAYGSYDNEQLDLKLKDTYLKKNLRAQLRLVIRPGIHYSHFFTLTYQQYDFSDTLLKLNHNYTFQGINHPDYLMFNYKIKADFRDFQPYPLEGRYFDLEIEKTGLAVTEENFPDYITAKSSFRRFLKICDRFYYAAGLTGKYSFGRVLPYFLQKGLGYDNDFVRGFEYYVVDGQDFILFRNNIKWNLLPQKVSNIKFIPTQKFSMIHYSLYVNVFADMAYVSDQSIYSLNRLANRWISGYGLGLDFVTYYDKVFRFEYSRNQRGESGLFVHFVAPI